MSRVVLLFALVAAAVDACAGEVKGTFVQKKYLQDIEVTLTSSGTWSFEKGRMFVWRTLKPVPSLFTATPTNYSFTAGSKVVTRRLDMKIDNLAQVFEMKEMKGVVDKVESDAAKSVFRIDGVDVPSEMRVFFKNGDRLEIHLKR